jgi:hypothetical protein
MLDGCRARSGAEDQDVGGQDARAQLRPIVAISLSE